MKKIFSISFIALILLSTATAFAQEDKSKRPSPPATFTTGINGSEITINYSQPSVKGRTIGNEIATYGEVWRTGANEATTFETSKNIKIEGKDLKAGKYALFTIPGENEWTVILNGQPKQWGAFKYDETQDVLRVTVKPGKTKSFTEQMTFAQNGDNIILMWGDVQVGFGVK